jgi:spore germination cell wall hydrolase CwlJ-like protein
MADTSDFDALGLGDPNNKPQQADSGSVDFDSLGLGDPSNPQQASAAAHQPPPKPPPKPPPRTPHGPTPRQASTAPPAPAPKEPDWKSMHWGDVFKHAGQVAGDDTLSNIQSIGHSIVHPIQTAGSLWDLGSGLAAQVGHKLTGDAYNPADAAKVAAARAVEHHFGDLGSGVLGTVSGDRLGDSGKLKKAIYTAPVSTAMDASMFTPIPGAALKGAASVAKLVGAAKTADRLATVGNIASKAARYTDPVNLALKTASGAADLAGAAPRAFMSARSGMTSDLQKVASAAGKNPLGRQSRSFLSNMTGIGGGDTIDAAAKLNKGLGKIQSEGKAAHDASMAAMQGAPSYDPIMEAINDARNGPNGLSPGGIDNGLNDAAHSALNDAEGAVRAHIQAHNDYIADPVANAALRPMAGVQGMHKLKQDLWNTIGGIRDPNAAGALKKVWGATRDELGKIDGYSDAMESSKAAMQNVTDMSKDLGIRGARTSTAGTIAKTLKKMKTPSGVSMVKQLNKVDPTIMPTLAGQAAHAGPQGGATNAILSMVNPKLGIPAVISSTPALVGTANYLAGAAGDAGSLATRAGRYAASVNDVAAPPEDQVKDQPDPAPQPQAAAPPPVKATAGDAVLAAKVAVAEAANQPPDGQAAVVHTMLNRAAQSGQSLGDVVTAKHQYTSLPIAEQLDDNDPRVQKMLHEIVIPALSGDLADPTGGSTHYYNPDLQAVNNRKDPVHNPLHPSFAKGDGRRIGDHVFYESSGGRVERASGGKVANPKQHEYLVNRLLRAAKEAKKITDTTTEPLLKAPDEHIVRALNVAQRAI